MTGSSVEIERLQKAVRWLRSHRRRLDVDRRSLEGQLQTLRTEVDRLGREIEAAEQRLGELSG